MPIVICTAMIIEYMVICLNLYIFVDLGIYHRYRLLFISIIYQLLHNFQLILILFFNILLIFCYVFQVSNIEFTLTIL